MDADELLKRLFEIGLLLGRSQDEAPSDRMQLLDEAVIALGALAQDVQRAAWNEARPMRILVVDDDDGVRTLLSMWLEDLGTVATCADAHAALSRLDEGDVDLLVLDLIMPGADGIELLRLLERRGRAVPTVLATGLIDEARIDPLLEDGHVSAVVTKPFGENEIREAVVRAARL